MKKIVFLFLILLFVNISTFAADTNTDCKKTNSIKFIYLNGSNSNDEKARIEYVTGMHKLQKEMKTVLEQEAFIQKYLLENGKYSIDAIPEILFWGFQSEDSLSYIDSDLSITELSSPKVAHTVRCFISHLLHDAIWVQKRNNMQTVTNQLNRMVIDSYNKGERVILLGHSAGSFVTYEYLLHKLKAVDINFFYNNNQSNTPQYTCFDAVVNSGLAYQRADGNLVRNGDATEFKKIYQNIDKYTKLYCAPDNTVAGVMNFGSPLALFYPDVMGKNTAMPQEQVFAFFKYLQKNNMFLLTVNFADDPIGFPVGKNISAQDIEMKYNSSLDKNGRGFFYNYTKTKSPATFVGAHNSYWKHPKKFANMCKEAYIKGLKNFYTML